MPDKLKILSPTAILGYGFPVSSFKAGLRRKPGLIAVDAGSTDPGPYYLGAGKSFTDRGAVKRDLELMLVAAVKQKIPVVIGSAGGAGAKPHLAWCRKIILEIAKEQQLNFRFATIAADISKSRVKKALRRQEVVSLPGTKELTEKIIDKTTCIVAQMGVEPIQEAHQQNCNVILCGRAYDPSVFAALPLLKGFDAGLALHLGKILECAAIASTPGSGADCVLGILGKENFRLETLSKARKFTAASTVAHSLYEKADPNFLYGPGGRLNLTNCKFDEDAKGVSVSGSRFESSDKYYIKLEGARQAGYRTLTIAGVRDPVFIGQMEAVIKKVKLIVGKELHSQGIVNRLYIHIYGKNGVMGDLTPKSRTQAEEVGVLIDAVAPSQKEADSACSLMRSTLLHYCYPGRIATAGNLAFPFSPSDIRGGKVFEFSVYHLMEIKNQSVFKLNIENI